MAKQPINSFNPNSTSTMSNPVYMLKVSESEKYKDDNAWFKNYMSYIIPSSNMIIEDYHLMKTSYEIINNNLDGFKNKIKQFCAPLGEDIGNVEEDIVPYPELYTKVNILKGEMLKRGDNFKIVLLTAQAIKEKNDALYEAVKASVDEKLALILEAQKEQLKGKTDEEIQQYMDSLRTQNEPEDILSRDWLSELEIFYSKALNYCYYDQDVKTKKLETFEDAHVVDRCFIYSGWKNGKPHLEIRNPLYCGFHKGPNERYVHKGDYLWYRKAITPAEALNTYNLTEDELSRLGMNTRTNGIKDQRHDLFGPGAIPVYDKTNQEMLMAFDKQQVHDKTIGTHQVTSKVFRHSADLIWETHFEFKAFKELIFLSYIDEYNQKVVTPLPSSFSANIPEDATKESFTNDYGEKADRHVWFDQLTGVEYRAERIWVPRRYEIVRLGNDVYPICREVPNQTTIIEDPFNTFELSTKGAVFTARNAKSVSPLQRALPAYFQYIFVKHIENKELAKYLGSTLDIDVDQIPDDLGKDLFGNDIRDKFLTWYAYLKKTGVNFFSGSQSALGGLPPATRSPGSKGNSFDNAMNLFNLQQLAELFKREIGMAMGISPQREASFSQGSNVTDNQQAIAQSYAITEPYFYLHNEIWKAALNDYLINFRTYCNNIFVNNPTLKDHSFHYILPNGTEELMKVTPKTLQHASVGLFLNNTGQEQRYIDTMFANAQAFAQNGGQGLAGMSMLIKSLVGGASPEEIHKLLVVEENKQAKRAEQMQQAQLQSQEKQVQMQLENREDIQRHELEKIAAKGEQDRMTQLQVASIDALGYAKEQDVDNNNVPDVIDLAKHYLDGDKLQLEKEKFAHQKKVDGEKLEIDKEKVKVARIKKQTTSSK